MKQKRPKVHKNLLYVFSLAITCEETVAVVFAWLHGGGAHAQRMSYWWQLFVVRMYSGRLGFLGLALKKE